MSERTTRVALISAVSTAIPPVQAAFQELYPEAELWNILDDRLLQDAASSGLTTALSERMGRLIAHGITEGADAVLLTCSLYGPVATAAAETADVPVTGPDDAVFAEAASGRYARVALVSSAATPLWDSLERFTAVADGRVSVTGVVAEGAVIASRVGDINTLSASIVEAVRSSPDVPDAILLGQYSLAPAAHQVKATLGIPTLSGPHFAVRRLHARLTGIDE